MIALVSIYINIKMKLKKKCTDASNILVYVRNTFPSFQMRTLNIKLIK